MNYTRINLWSSPRNVSTALMYSFAQRADTKVFDEPLFAHFLKETGAERPSREETLATLENDGEKIVAKTILGNHNKPVLFFKNMTNHLVNLDDAFLSKTYNVLLTRNPHEIIASYAKVIPNPTIDDIGWKLQCELMQKLENEGTLTAILDAKYVLMNPKKVLTQLCEKLGIPFDENMLQWKAGARSEDGVWAKYWYHNVHKSTGFKKYEPKEIALTGKLKELADTCMPYYNELHKSEYLIKQE